MNMGNSEEINQNENEIGNQQAQIQSNKQIILLKQDQNSSNSIMCKVLSDLESLAIDLGYKKQTLFGYYSSKSKNRKEIIDRIILQMTIFESSYKNYVKKNPNKIYEYPDNLKLSDIQKIVNGWKKFIEKNSSNKSYISYFDEFLNILDNKDISKTINDEFDNLDKNSKQLTNAELKRAMNAAAIATYHNNERNNEIEKEINEKGQAKINIILGADRNDNKFSKSMDKYDENLNKLKKELYLNLDLILGNLEIYTILKANSDNNLKIKYSNKLKNKNLEKEIISEYNKLLDKYIKIGDKLFDEYSFSITNEEKDKIKKELENWKKNIKEKKDKDILNEAIEYICEEQESGK